MNFPDLLLPGFLLWTGNALALFALLAALQRAPWDTLKRPDLLNVWLGAAVALMLVWSIKTGIKPGLNFHLLGSTLLTLMFGPWLALVMLAVVLVAVTLAGAAGWASLGVNFLLMAALPVVLSHVLYRITDARLPNHFFIYIFVNAFLGAGLAMAACGLAATLLLTGAGIYSSDYLSSQYLPYFILMAWSEAMLTGMVMTLMVVYRPDWVATFDDARYIRRK